MTESDCNNLLDSYAGWFRSNLAVSRLEVGCELTTPFLDRHNDHLQVYAVQRNGSLLLSDDGYMLADLRTAGVDIASLDFKPAVLTLLQGFGVRIQDKSIVTEASPDNLGQRVHLLIQAMLGLNDLSMMQPATRQAYVDRDGEPRRLVFREEVYNFLSTHQVPFEFEAELPGKSGFAHTISFVIRGNGRHRPKLLETVKSPTTKAVGECLWKLQDIRQGGTVADAYAILNDQGRKVRGGALEPFKAYDVVPLLWSSREDFVGRLLG